MGSHQQGDNPLEVATGPFYEESACARWLGLSADALRAKADDLTVLRLVTGDGTQVYPAWQFTDDRQVIPHLAEVLRALAKGTDDSWTMAVWLTAPGGEDDPRKPWQRLAAGEAAEDIRQAHEDGARWAT